MHKNNLYCDVHYYYVDGNESEANEDLNSQDQTSGIEEITASPTGLSPSLSISPPKSIVQTFSAINGYLENEGQDEPSKPKRKRTSFSNQQLSTMRHYFSINPRPNNSELKIIAQKTRLEKKVLQVIKGRNMYVKYACYA